MQFFTCTCFSRRKKNGEQYDAIVNIFLAPLAAQLPLLVLIVSSSNAALYQLCNRISRSKLSCVRGDVRPMFLEKIRDVVKRPFTVPKNSTIRYTINVTQEKKLHYTACDKFYRSEKLHHTVCDKFYQKRKSPPYTHTVCDQFY